jgi:hypothetical protein
MTGTRFIVVWLRRLEWPRGVLPRGGTGFYFVENLYTIVLWYVCPGFNSTDGKFGLFGESGWCCGSRQKPV